jgi:poly(3-hydroxybutyrate) depolymerase
MHTIKTFAIFVTMAATLHAQDINIRGKVADSAGRGVSGAVVELVRQGLKDTTGPDGRYVLAGGVTAVRALPVGPEMSMDAGVLQLRVAEPAAMAIEAYDARGNLLWKEAVKNATAGWYSWNFADYAPSANLLIIQASVGAHSRAFRYLSPGRGRPSALRPAAAFSPAGAAPAKTAAVLDTLKATATGYRAKTVPVESWDATVDIALEAAASTEKNPPVKSAGCGKNLTMTNGKKTITSEGEQRTYIIDIPTNYDKDKPYRLFYCSHWIGSTSEAVRDQNYYFLKPLANAANEPAIFIAPQSQGSTWQQKDHALFDNILAMAKENLCFDESRVFATGFSFGGMITYSLSTNHQKQIRAAVGIGPANYNIWLPNPKLTDPIAWMQTTGMRDRTTPWIDGNSTTRGAKFIAFEKARDNGCTIPADIPTAQQGAHICYDFQGCRAGYPVKACTFSGDHTNIASDPGSSVNWIPQESWKFFTQF